MSSNSASGKHSLFIYFAFWTVWVGTSSQNWIVGKQLLYGLCQGWQQFPLPRYRQVPSFGRDTIRRFSRNVSELKRMAARDFEDLLQVSTLVSDSVCNSDDLWYYHYLVVCHPGLHWPPTTVTWQPSSKTSVYTGALAWASQVTNAYWRHNANLSESHSWTG